MLSTANIIKIIISFIIPYVAEIFIAGILFIHYNLSINDIHISSNIPRRLLGLPVDDDLIVLPFSVSESPAPVLDAFTDNNLVSSPSGSSW